MRRARPLLVLLVLAACVRANAGVLAGVITDATAQPLRAVSVVAEPTATATSTSPLETESDADGRYSLSLPAGTHQVSFRLAGYALQVTRVTVEESGPLARDVTLQLALASSVVVQARATFAASRKWAPPSTSSASHARPASAWSRRRRSRSARYCGRASLRERARARGHAAQRRGQGQPVLPARLQPRPRHRPRDLSPACRSTCRRTATARATRTSTS